MRPQHLGLAADAVQRQHLLPAPLPLPPLGADPHAPHGPTAVRMRRMMLLKADRVGQLVRRALGSPYVLVLEQWGAARGPAPRPLLQAAPRRKGGGFLNMLRSLAFSSEG